jgi:hypothetical protein
MALNKHETGKIDVYHKLKTTLDHYYRSIVFVSIGSKEGQYLKQWWEEHLNTFGRIRWIIKHQRIPSSDKKRYHLIIEHQSTTDPAQFFSCWMIDLP